jgi:hypothetical protein
VRAGAWPLGAGQHLFVVQRRRLLAPYQHASTLTLTLACPTCTDSITPPHLQASESDEVRLLKEFANDDDWGLDGLPADGRGSRPRRTSLLAEIARQQRESEDAGDGAAGAGESMMWGGSGGATGIDMEEQEEVLSRFFRPHEVKRYMAIQKEIDENYAAMKVSRVLRGKRARQAGPRWPAALELGS